MGRRLRSRTAFFFIIAGATFLRRQPSLREIVFYTHNISLMKHLFVLSVILLTSVSAFADTAGDTAAIRKNSIAVNVNGLLAQMFTNNYYAPSVVTYRRTSGRNALRVGLGGSLYAGDRMQNDTNNAQSQFYRSIARIGWERTMLKYNKWSAYAGLDVVVSYNYSAYSVSSIQGYTTKNVEKTLGLGLSPVAGLVYAMNPMISFGAEAGLDFLVESEIRETEYFYPSGVVYNRVMRSSEFLTRYNSPLALSVRICF